MDESAPTGSGSRREELIAAALMGDLGPDERPEFDALCAADPTVLVELAEMEQMTRRLTSSGLEWIDAEPSAGLADRVLAVTTPAPGVGPGAVPIGPGSVPGDELAALRERKVSSSGRARGWIAAVAVAAVFVGAVGALGVQSLVDQPPTGPPGTLGAVEPVRFDPSPLAGEVDASLVAHTWGTETVLEVDGFPVGQVFEVVLINTRDEPVGSGAFIGASGTVDCRMNAGVPRSDVRGVQIQDAQGEVLLSAEVPSI